jgi:peptidoglycan-associated lipoprotein
MLDQVSLRRAIAVLVLAAALGLAGCAHKKPKFAPAPGPSAAEAGAEGSGANNPNATGAAEQEAAGPQGGLLATRIVYFDFDSSEIKGQGTDVVAAHAKYLAGASGARVRLEGHTDERGSREYNIGLGERRAQAVRRALLLQGASDGQISTVSYGEERPAAPGHDEAAWAKNRRVEIVYLMPATAPHP